MALSVSLALDTVLFVLALAVRCGVPLSRVVSHQSDEIVLLTVFGAVLLVANRWPCVCGGTSWPTTPRTPGVLTRNEARPWDRLAWHDERERAWLQARTLQAQRLLLQRERVRRG